MVMNQKQFNVQEEEKKVGKEEELERIFKSSEPLPNEKKDENKPVVEDGFAFIQCENSTYLIEKSLGSGEKMLVFHL